MTFRRGSAVAVAGFALAIAAVALGGSAASAHDSLVDATPAEGQSVATLDEVRMEFSGDLLGADEGADIIQVVGADGTHYETGCAAVAGPVITVPVALGGAGTYTVQWRIVSSDGHPVAQAYTFDYDPAEGTPIARGSGASPCSSAATTAGTDAPDPGDASTAANTVNGLSIGLVIGGVVVIGVLIAVVAILRRSSSPASGENDPPE
ncbi:copper resistance CopC family protein [Microbacterium rhizomatis]|uniref:Copper resistance protein CopC n=1 Tax=Microbacterium rhizomatis TaxID=1631477 RepID=A0A5J5J2W4_9MICO|nr:copper resistance CopC family protein [Microbacterium rhizomatis]KAA9107508.1 copper resistance protein CopC [Microbacterium rhizomatis]